LRVLIIEDEPVIGLNAEAIILDLGHRRLLARSLGEAKEVIASRPLDVALVDIALPDGDGFELLDELVNSGIPSCW
jgi:DNA-binding response OmpR family regulator